MATPRPHRGPATAILRLLVSLAVLGKSSRAHTNINTNNHPATGAHHIPSPSSAGAAAGAGVVQCPRTLDGKPLQQTSCPSGWACAAKVSGTGACHFEYPPSVKPHRENCYGCTPTATKSRPPLACEPNLPTVPMSTTKPNILIVGDSISHGYFPILAAAALFAQFQHAPSNTGALQAGVECFNITTLLGATADQVVWDLVVFNFGLHDTSEPTPPPAERTTGSTGAAAGSSARAPRAHTAHSWVSDTTPVPWVSNYMRQLERYTNEMLRSARAKKALFALTTPYMAGGVYKILEQMNGNATEFMGTVDVPTVDLYTPIVNHCTNGTGVLPYSLCDICMGSVPGHPVNCCTTPHYTEAGYQLLVDALVPAIKSAIAA